MLLGRVTQFLSLQLLQCTDDAETGITRFYHIINVTIFSCIIRIGEQLGVFCFFFGQECGGVFLFLRFACVQYFYCACTTHYCNFGCGPCIVHVTAKLLTAHYNMRTAV